MDETQPIAEDGELQRPPAAELVERFQQLVKDPMLSAAHVRRQATSGSIAAPGEASLRSLYWRICWGILSTSPPVWPDAFRRLRQSWADLHDYLRAPDGMWVEGAKPPSDWRGSNTPAVVHNPLGDETGNPWPAWYEDLELRRVIRQDVDRTFPDNPYFRSKRVKNSLTNILFCFAKLHVDVSYRQGMHEILAIIFWCTDMDSVEGTYDPRDISSLPYLVLSRDHVEHDAYTLFNAIMTSMLSWYDPNLSVPSHLGTSIGPNQSPSPTLVQPIVAKCSRIHDLLKKVDFELWKRMEELKIEPQIYGIRWLRLLFSREFPIAHTLKLWDAIFAEDIHPPLHIADYICLAMLLRIRESLLDSDYSTFLHGLLRYPLPADGDPRVLLIAQQASYLRDNPTNFGGAYVRRQNTQLGAEAGLKTGSRAEEAMYENGRGAGTPSNSAIYSRQINPSTAALIDQGRSIAEGLYGRAEALGINKAVFSALGDLKKSVQSYQAQQTTSNFSEIPTTPSWQVDAVRNRGLDLKNLRNENLAMGNALAASLRILQSEFEKFPQRQSESVLASLRTIEHVKDVLAAKNAHFDPKYAEDLVGAASGGLLQEARSIPPASVVPPSSASYLMDQSSPTMPEISTLAPVARPATKNHAVTPRSASAQAGTDKGSVPSDSTHLPLAPLPTHSYQFVNNHANSTSSTFPDLGDWQASIEPVGHPLSGMPAMPRIPPTSRTVRVQGLYRQPLQGGTPIEPLSSSQRSQQSRRQPEESDPLGALF